MCQKLKYSYSIDQGKALWVDFQEFLDAFKCLVKEKNPNNTLQSLLHNLQVSAKTPEEAAIVDLPWQLSWFIFLACTSPDIRELVTDAFQIVTRILGNQFYDEKEETESRRKRLNRWSSHPRCQQIINDSTDEGIMFPLSM
jgi:hypothetical protein